MNTEISGLDLPKHFSDEARDLIEGFLDDLADDQEVDAIVWGSLMQVGELISTADRLDAVARESGYMALGSAGQQVLHPAVTEARQVRATAAATLAAIAEESGRRDQVCVRRRRLGVPGCYSPMGEGAR